MTSNGIDIPEAFWTALAERLGAERFELWFGPTTRLERHDGRLVVAARDRFHRDWLMRNFRGVLGVVAEEVFGHELNIEFAIDGSLRPAQTTTSHGAAAVQPPAAAATPAREAATSQAGEAPSAWRRPFGRLEEFVVGPGNQLAWSAVSRAAQEPGQPSPLFLYGPPGVGKTHLLEALWVETRRRHRSARCVFLSAEQFTTGFVEAVQGDGLPSFRQKYRAVHLLAIDDVQFFVGKRATLVEFQHTVDTLLRQGAQLAFSADRRPHEITGLGAELATRLQSGLECPVEPADEATRRAIVGRMAAARGIAVPADVLDLLAAELPDDARRLLGALHRLQAVSQTRQQPIDRTLAEQALADLIACGRRPIAIADIEQAVCAVCGVEPEKLHSTSKSKDIAQTRMLAMWLARRWTRSALSEIGSYFGRRSHTTVLSAQRKVEGWLSDGSDILLARGHCRAEEAIRQIEGRLRRA